MEVEGKGKLEGRLFIGKRRAKRESGVTEFKALEFQEWECRVRDHQLLYLGGNL